MSGTPQTVPKVRLRRGDDVAGATPTTVLNTLLKSRPVFEMLPTSPFTLSLTATTGREVVPYLRRHLLAARRMVRTPLHELSIALVGDTRMAALHQQFLGIPGPTDVLTFPLDEDARGRVIAGEVVICVPTARRRSRLEGTSVTEELLLYAMHGMLHLCGYDDTTESGFRRMHRTEDRLLKRLGVGPLFWRQSSGPLSKVR